MSGDQHRSKRKFLRTPKGLLIIGLILALLGGVSWHFASNREIPIQVVGNLAPEDVDNIKRLARQVAWHHAFYDFSWSTIKQIPKKLKPVRAHISSIVVQADGSAFVVTTTERGASIDTSPTYFYLCARTSNNWRCYGSGQADPVRVDIKPSNVVK